MANRRLLHPNHLSRFKEFLDAEEILWRDTDADYQVIQVQIGSDWVPIYKKMRTVHYTITSKLIPLVESFMEDI